MNPLGDTPEPARGRRLSPLPAACPARLPGPAGGLDGRLALPDQILELGLLGGQGVGLGGEVGDPLVQDGLGLLLVLLQQGHGLHGRLGVGGPLRLARSRAAVSATSSRASWSCVSMRRS